MKNINPIFKRYLKVFVILLVSTFLWITYNGISLINAIESNVKNFKIGFEREFIKASDIDSQTQFYLNSITQSFKQSITLNLILICIVSTALCLVLYFERKQLYSGFLNVLPIRQKKFFDYATGFGFAYIILSQIFMGIILLIAAPQALSVTVAMSEHVLLDSKYIITFFFLRVIISLYFYGLVLLCQQLLCKPIVASAVAFGIVAAPNLLLTVVDKFLYVLLGYIGHRVGHFSNEMFGWFNPIRSPWYSSYGAESAISRYLIYICVYLVLAVMLFILAKRFSSKTPIFAVGLYAFPWVKPIITIGFVICVGASFANFMPLMMGFIFSDFTLAIMLQMFVIGIVAGIYMYKKLTAVLDN